MLYIHILFISHIHPGNIILPIFVKGETKGRIAEVTSQVTELVNGRARMHTQPRLCFCHLTSRDLLPPKIWYEPLWDKTDKSRAFLVEGVEDYLPPCLFDLSSPHCPPSTHSQGPQRGCHTILDFLWWSLKTTSASLSMQVSLLAQDQVGWTDYI